MKGKLQIPGLKDEDIEYLVNLRNYKYYCATVANFLKGICPFCTIDPAVNKVFYENDTWVAFHCPSAFKAKNLEYHIVLAPRKHHTHFCGMSDQEKNDWVKTLGWVISSYDLQGGAIVMRFGDASLNAGSIRHLHANIMVPDKKGRVEVTLAKSPEEVEEKWRMVAVFEKMRQGMPFYRLTADEQALVHNRL